MQMSSRFLALGVLGVLLVGSDATYAQVRATEKLASAKSVKCVFPVMATGTWNKGEARAETKSATLSVGFDSIDTDEGTARMTGMADIIVRLSSGTLHFVQSFREGPLYTTTIFPKETRDGKLQAVHTRHEYTEVSLPGFTSRPEQYYGECEVAQ